MELKEPLIVDKQVDKLLEHGMVVSDREFAKKVLSRMNYYRFTGYALHFRDGSNKYKEGTSFNSVFRICCFDEEMRHILRKYIEKIEVYYRMQIAYGFAMNKCISSPYDQHYLEKNFYNKKGYQEVMASLEREKTHFKDSLIVKHHKMKYSDKMPVWVIVELLSFSNLSKLYSSMYYSEKERIATLAGTGKKTLENHLHCMSVLRNMCAHAARLYGENMNPPAIFQSRFLRKYPQFQNDTLFAYVLVLIKRLPNKQDRESLISDLEKLLLDYKDDIDLKMIGFPNEYSTIMSMFR